jgi:hypothetical protein
MNDLGLRVAAALLLVACAGPGAPAPASATPRPPLQDGFLDHLVGEWNLTREGRGRTARNSVAAQWVLGHQFVELHMIDVEQPPTYEALVLIGYDVQRAQYVVHWCDSFGGGYAGVGRGVRRGDAIEFRFDYPDGPFFNTIAWDAAAGAWTCTLENGAADGTRRPFAVDRLVRR